MGLPFQVYVAGKSWTDEHHVHLMLDPSYEPSQMHEIGLFRNENSVKEEKNIHNTKKPLHPPKLTYEEVKLSNII